MAFTSPINPRPKHIGRIVTEDWIAPQRIVFFQTVEHFVLYGTQLKTGVFCMGRKAVVSFATILSISDQPAAILHNETFEEAFERKATQHEKLQGNIGRKLYALSSQQFLGSFPPFINPHFQNTACRQ